MGIRIDQLPTTNIPAIDHVLAAIKDGFTVQLSVAQILGLKTALETAYAASGPSGLGVHTTVKAALDILGQRLLAAESAVNAASANATRALGLELFKNKIINGNFVFNQRASGDTVAAGVFRFDRWKAGAGGCTASAVTSGADNVVTITEGTLIQVIEDLYVDGGNYVLSWTGTAWARVSFEGSAFTSYATSPITMTVSANNSITVEFNTGTLDKVQLESGTTSTSFERRGRPFELMLCQRYYCTSPSAGEIHICPAPANTFGGTQPVYFPVAMRTVPTVNRNYSVTYAATALLNLLTTERGYIHYILANSGTNAQANWTWGASAEL